MDNKSGGFPGHDEGSNKPPNAPSGVYQSGSGTYAPLSSTVDGGTTQKNSLGSTGKADGQE